MIVKVAQPNIGSEEIEAVKRVMLSGNYVSGNNVKEFESEFAKYIGTKYAVAVNSGTAALHIALAVSGIGFTDEVIVPPLTFFSTISSVLHQYGIPVFADIDPNSYCISPRDIKIRITKKTKAIIPVHLFGNAAEMNMIREISKEYGLKIIEDCAQAHGTEYFNRKVGSIGDIGIFSFFATKHITTGEGGMIVTNNKKWAEMAKQIRSHGMTGRDNHDLLGYNYRMNEISAAIGNEQLKKIEILNKKRIENSLYLYSKLKDEKIQWIKLPELKNEIKHTFFWFPVFIKENNLGIKTTEIREKLLGLGIETRHRYLEPLYKQKILVEKEKFPHSFLFKGSNINYSEVFLQNAEYIAGKMLGLPNHPGLDRDDLDMVIDAIKKIDREVSK